MTYVDHYWEQEIAKFEKEKKDLDAALKLLQNRVGELESAPLTDVARQEQEAALAQQLNLVRAEMERVEKGIEGLSMAREVAQEIAAKESMEVGNQTETWNVRDEGREQLILETAKAQEEVRKIHKEVGKAIDTCEKTLSGEKNQEDGFGAAAVLAAAAVVGVHNVLDERREKKEQEIDKIIAEHPSSKEEVKHNQVLQDLLKDDLVRRDQHQLDEKLKKEHEALDKNYVIEQQRLSDAQQNAQEKGDNAQAELYAEKQRELDELRERMHREIERQRGLEEPQRESRERDNR